MTHPRPRSNDTTARLAAAGFVPDPNIPGCWRVTSRSSGRVYLVQAVDGRAVCDCPGFRHHRACWHADLAQEKTMPNEVPAPSHVEEDVTTAPTAPLAMTVQPPTRFVPSPGELKAMSELSRTLPQVSGLAIPRSLNTPAKVWAVLFAGWELGVRPMTALRHAFVVNGRVDFDAQLMMGLVVARDPGARYVWIETTPEAAEVELQRPGRPPTRVRYSIQDAQRSGQTKERKDQAGADSNPWNLFPADMLRWAAVKRVNRLGAPEIINEVGALPPIALADDAIEAEGYVVADPVTGEIVEPASDETPGAEESTEGDWWPQAEANDGPLTPDETIVFWRDASASGVTPEQVAALLDGRDLASVDRDAALAAWRQFGTPLSESTAPSLFASEG